MYHFDAVGLGSDADLKFENWKLRRRVEKLQEYIDEVRSAPASRARPPKSSNN